MKPHSPAPTPPPIGGAEPPRRNWAGWYPDGEDLIFEQTGYDLRTPALAGLVGFIAALAVLLGLLAQGLPDDPIGKSLSGALLLVTTVALVACATVARQVLRPIHRIARFSRAQQSLILRDRLALGTRREQRVPYAQLTDVRTRHERALSVPPSGPPGAPHNYLLAYPVAHIELARSGLPPLTLTTGALLSAQAAQRGVEAINAHLQTARQTHRAVTQTPTQTPTQTASPPQSAPAQASQQAAAPAAQPYAAVPRPSARPATNTTRRSARRPIPPRPLR